MAQVPKRSYINRRVFAALAALALFSLVTTITSVAAITKMAQARRASLVDSNVRTSLLQFVADLNASESAQRGYLLSGDPAYLAPYTRAEASFPARIKELNNTAKGTHFEAAIAHLTPLVDAKLAEVNSTITAYNTTGQPAALAIVTTNQGQQLMAHIQTLVAQTEDQLDSDIATDRQTVNYYVNFARLVGVLALLGTFVLVAGIYILFSHAIEAERELDRAKDEFVSLASHQLRTPATGIKSILSMVHQGDFGPLNEVQTRVLGKAIDSNERELSIIEELLNVAKADAGRLVFKPSDVNITTLIDTIVGEQRESIKAKQIKLKVDSPDEPVHLIADGEKLYMAISNLVDNACKYTPQDGKITISVGSRRGNVLVEVTDSGIGIDDKELAYIFDRFQRARLVLAGTVEGTGLGLYLARRIAELHHGTINVDSKKGHGSRFTLVLPRSITV